MKIKALLSAFLLLTSAAHASIYALAPGGNDSGPGTQSAPFATLGTAVDHLKAGDTLLIRQGTYHVPTTVQLPSSGTEAAPIKIQAWPSECPLLDGAKAVAGPWSLDSGSVYKALWPSQPTQVFCDGHLLNEARWPAAEVLGLSRQPVAIADWGSTTATACSKLTDALAGLTLTGALLQIMPGQSWCSYTRSIASVDASGTIAFDRPIKALAALYPRRGDRFYVFGLRSLLTAAGQWYWDPATKLLYVWTPDGKNPGATVEAGVAGCVLSLDARSWIDLNSINVLGGGITLHDSEHCALQDCHLNAPNWTRLMDGYETLPQVLGGVEISGSDNQWLGGSVQYAGRSGVLLEGSRNSVQDVAVVDCGWNWGNDGGIHIDKATQCAVQECTVQRMARAGIFQYDSTDSRIFSNLIQDVGLYSSDIGSFDSWGSSGAGTLISSNLCQGNHAMWGSGIYLDDRASDFTVENNEVDDSTWYGFTFKALNTERNNTALSVGHSALLCLPPAGLTLTGATFIHNQVAEAFPIRVSLQTPNVTDYGYYGGYAYLSASGRVELDWSQLDQPWWAVQVPPALSATAGITFAMDEPGTFNYRVSNLRFLPVGGSGDTGSVPVQASFWYVSAGAGSSATQTVSGPPAWGASGISVKGGWNSLGAGLPAGMQNLSAFRGLAFDLSGTATRSYAWQGCVDLDNGALTVTGRGADLPEQPGADLGTAMTCQGGPPLSSAP